MDEAFYPKDNFFFPLLSSARCCTLKLAPDYCETLKFSRGRSAKRLKASGGVWGTGGAAATSRRSRARTMLAVKGDYL